MTEQTEHPLFEPTMQAAWARLDAVDPTAYARTRNRLDGAVTRLSPYITHGFFSLPDVVAAIRTRHAMGDQTKFVYELGWREYFRHVHRHEGERIFESLHEGVLPDAAYASELPADIRTGATGLPVIDHAVRQLYATGWLHNHARMWLASYVVHLRKVSWRAGADWLYGHLLDGDLASNHLSWQWVASTGSHKPYLFNADNVARYAPAPWHCKGSLIDTDYATLDRLARSPEPVAVAGGDGVDEPPLLAEPPRSAKPPRSVSPDAWLVHPWALGPVPAGRKAQAVFDPAFHRRWPWSSRRWSFVLTRQAELAGLPCPHSFEVAEQPALFDDPGERCASFSKWWLQVQGPGRQRNRNQMEPE